MAGRVAGKVSIVTGGASGIGRACSMLLTAEGSTVVVTDIQDEAGAAVVAEIQAAGGSASYLHHDVTSEDEWKAVATSVMEAHGRIDVCSSTTLASALVEASSTLNSLTGSGKWRSMSTVCSWE